MNRRWARAKLPKLGWVRFRWSRPLGGTVKNATVAREGRRWYISFLVDDGEQPLTRHARPDTGIGVDRGVAKIGTTSEGQFHHKVFARDREVEHAVKLQRDLARTTKGSNRRTRAARRVGAFAARIRRRREDFAAKTAHALTRDHDLIVFEALKTKNMTATAKPKPDPGRPGTFLPNGAAAKSGLNRAILDKGWHRIELTVRSKARYTGTCVITVNPANTSITCHESKKVDAKSRKSQTVFACTSCRHRDHAYVNAAKNILTAGRAELAQARPVARVGARKPRSRVGRKVNRQATASGAAAKTGSRTAGIPRP
ncbi:transposase [Nonomuraea sp. NPDC049784]|uniref:RNA-guided endonuclease InsQ/TnpB family protein n=1 Tax=Nonomuraea sp. NPDC049784 TaxID=3154361 RepID=UPI0033D82D69